MSPTDSSISRRSLLQTAGSTALGAAVLSGVTPSGARGIAQASSEESFPQSVCRWCYGRMPLDELAKAAADMGLRSVEIIGPEDFATVQKYGLGCAMVNTHSLTEGINNPDNHAKCIDAIERSIDAASDAGYPNVITFSGNRNGMPDDVGLENCVEALQKVVGRAEKKGVTICLELLNSKVDHKDYMGDHMPWGIELVERVGSERFKLLYDIYHMQIMDGDVIRTIQDHHEIIGHYHTAGVPGRHELDENQELYYPAIMRAIAATGYQGYVGQEFIPTGDPLTSLRHGVEVCRV